jgi:hypothetical protein
MTRRRNKKKKFSASSSSSSSLSMTFSQIHSSVYASSFAVSFAVSFAASYASYSASYSASYASQYASQYASLHDFVLHVFASQHSNQFEKTLHLSSKSASISQASFNSMKDHDLKIYIDWHIQSKSHKREILRFVLNQLIEQKYDLQTIQTLKDSENRAFWQELNILSNIEIQLIRDVSKFDREMTSRRRMFSSLSISSFQRTIERTLSLNHDLSAEKKMTARLFTQNLQFTQSQLQLTQNKMSFSQRSTQNEDDDQTRRTWNTNLQYDNEKL